MFYREFLRGAGADTATIYLTRGAGGGVGETGADGPRPGPSRARGESRAEGTGGAVGLVTEPPASPGWSGGAVEEPGGEEGMIGPAS